MIIQTGYTIKIGGAFYFVGESSHPLKIGSVVGIHNFRGPVYGVAEIVEVPRPNYYKAVRVH